MCIRDRIKADCLAGRRQDRQTIIDLLAICPGSEEYRYLCQAAREAAAVITGGEAYLWGAIGVDFAPCPMTCRFCSLGESWGIVRDEVSYSEDEIISQIRQYVNCGVRFIVLRTTEFYSVDTLCTFIPVSYTHLDVYKRQSIYSFLTVAAGPDLLRPSRRTRCASNHGNKAVFLAPFDQSCV